MDAVKIEPTSDSEVDPLSLHGDVPSLIGKEVVSLSVPVLKLESQENDPVETNESFDVKEHFKELEDDTIHTELNDVESKMKSDDTEMKDGVCFEFADVSKVKCEKEEVEEGGESVMQIEEDNCKSDVKKDGEEGAVSKEEDDKVDLGELKQYNPYFKPVLRNGPYSRSADGLHICDICNKSFGDNFNLTIHYRIHTGERPHVCSECGKGFTQFSNLKIHGLVHTGERPHLCMECGRSFRRAAHLHKHALLHTGQRPHVCNVCSKTFVCLTDLKNHSFIHTVDRPHKCEFCTKTFATPARLRRHRYTHKNLM